MWGDGHNRWPVVHRLDAALLFRLALEKGLAGSAYHAIAEEGVPFRDIADVIGRRLNLSLFRAAPHQRRMSSGPECLLSGPDNGPGRRRLTGKEISLADWPLR